MLFPFSSTSVEELWERTLTFALSRKRERE